MRPLLEYASSVSVAGSAGSVSVAGSARHPAKRNIDKIEAMIQRGAARFVLNRYHNTPSVSAMLDLHQRRKSARLAMLWKINNMVHLVLI